MMDTFVWASMDAAMVAAPGGPARWVDIANRLRTHVGPPDDLEIAVWQAAKVRYIDNMAFLASTIGADAYKTK